MSKKQQRLLSILKAVQVQQIYVHKMMHAAICCELREALWDQYNIYHTIELEIYAIASSRRWDICGINQLKVKTTAFMCHFWLLLANNDAKIAEIVIQKNAHCIINQISNKKYNHSSDRAVASLSNRLLVCSDDIVKRMQGFL